MNECTAGWPDAPSDVSPDAMDAFLAHVDGCPFHAKALSLETEELRARYRFAKGLDTHGRILVGHELRVAVAAYDQQNNLGEEAAPGMELPFKRIYLTNKGEDIAGSGKFFDFRRYEGEHQLDPEAGLQIWGVIGEGDSAVKVLLGFYALRGVRHTGEEQFLPLKNGYTVGLRVEQLSAQVFNIGFRCMENDKKLLKRITVNPEIFGGKPIIRGMRISVELILSLLVQGETPETILADYPDLEPDDLRACLAYAHAVIAHDKLDGVHISG